MGVLFEKHDNQKREMGDKKSMRHHVETCLQVAMTSHPSWRLILVTSLVPGVEPEVAHGEAGEGSEGQKTMDLEQKWW